MANPKYIRVHRNSTFQQQRPDGQNLSSHITIRPHLELEDDFIQMLDWCQENQSTMNTIFNSFVPAIAYALWHDIFKDKDGNTHVHADFGDVLIRPCKKAFKNR